jgi:hypothetical protein
VPVSSLHSSEDKGAEVITKAISTENDSAVATQLRSKDKTVKKSQRAKRGQKPVKPGPST